MDQGLSGNNPLSYRGVNASSPPELVIHQRAPTTRDYKNFIIGTIWLNNAGIYLPIPIQPTNLDVYMLVCVKRNRAEWVLFGSAGVLKTLSDDIGTVVHPDAAGNIKILGTPGHITTDGTLLANGITIDTGTEIVGQITADDANHALPVAGNINIFGGANIYTSVPAPGTIQVDLIGTTDHSLQIGNIAGSLTSLGVAGNGELPIGSTGVDPVLNTLTPLAGIAITNTPGNILIENRDPLLPAFHGYIAAALLPNVTGGGGPIGHPYQILFDSVVFDTTGSLNLITGGYIAPYDGSYFFQFNCSYQSTVGGAEQFSINFTKNTGTAIGISGGLPTMNRIANFYGPNNGLEMSLGGVIYCNAGDSIECYVNGSHGAQLDGIIGSGGVPGYGSNFFGFYIGQ